MLFNSLEAKRVEFAISKQRAQSIFQNNIKKTSKKAV